MKRILAMALSIIMMFSVTTVGLSVEAAAKNTVKTSITKVESKAKGFKVTWKKKSKIKGYQIQYSTSSKFKKSSTKTKTISKAKTKSATISKLKGCNVKYYVRVRTYKTSKGKKIYSSWSKSKKVTTLKHKYNKATCTKAKTCKYCKKTSGKKLGHDFVDYICTECDSIENPYAYLKTWVFSNGETKGSLKTVTKTFRELGLSNVDGKFNVGYDANADDIYISILYPRAKNEVLQTVILLDDETNYKYVYATSITNTYTNTTTHRIGGTINALNYTTDSPISYSYYNGNYAHQYQTSEISRAAIIVTIQGFHNFLAEEFNSRSNKVILTVLDFGFGEWVKEGIANIG